MPTLWQTLLPDPPRIYTSSSDLTSLENLPLGWRTGRALESLRLRDTRSIPTGFGDGTEPEQKSHSNTATRPNWWVNVSQGWD